MYMERADTLLRRRATTKKTVSQRDAQRPGLRAAAWTSERPRLVPSGASGERVRKAAAPRRNPQRAERAISAERAIKPGPPDARAGQALDSDLLLITDPEPDQAPEVGQKPLALILWIGHVDRFGEHPVEVRR